MYAESAARLRLGVRPLALSERLRLVGIEMMPTQSLRPVRHTLLRPRGLRLVRSDMGKAGEIDGTNLEWHGVRSDSVDPATAGQCFWDFLKLWDQPADAYLRFVQTWGLFDAGFRTAEGMARLIPSLGVKDILKRGAPAGPSWTPLRTIADRSAGAEAFIRTLIATESGQVASEDDLDRIEDPALEESGDSATYPWKRRFLEQLQRVHGLPLQREIEELKDFHMQQQETLKIMRQHRASLRARGQKIDHQKAILVTTLDRWLMDLEIKPFWDNRGRRMEAIAGGVYEIVAAHLGHLFDSPMPDVYVCSNCKRPFPFDEGDGRRRPKQGQKRFCSESCRAEAKRLDKLASWHRNKAKYRPGSAKRGGRDAE